MEEISLAAKLQGIDLKYFISLDSCLFHSLLHQSVSQNYTHYIFLSQIDFAISLIEFNIHLY